MTIYLIQRVLSLVIIKTNVVHNGEDFEIFTLSSDTGLGFGLGVSSWNFAFESKIRL